MSISNLIPTLQPMVENVSVELRFICYFILTASIIVQIARHHHHEGMPTMVRPIITATVITGLIATLPLWFNLIRETFWSIAMIIREEFASSVAPTGTALLQLIKPPDGGINWLDVTDSLMKAIQYAIGWLIVFFGAIIQLPMMLVQYVMECLCYLFLPIALTLFAIESTRGLAIRYIQQTLAILAWPIGFAVVDLVGYSLLSSVPSLPDAVAATTKTPVYFTPNNFMLGGVVALWIILGSLGTPIIMQMLFCSGSPMSSLVGQSIQMGLMAAGMMRMGGSPKPPTPPAIPSGATNTPSTGGGSGGGGDSRPQSPPEPPPAAPGTSAPKGSSPTPAPASGNPTHNSPPRGFTQPAPQSPLYDPLVDPTGDRQSADLMASTQIHQPVRY